jgi:hypothetical protein
MIENAEVDIMYSDVEGDWVGESNHNVNPMFEDEMHHLSAMSQCVDQGADSADFNGTWLYAPAKDMDGDDRPHPATGVDIGADETPYFLWLFDKMADPNRCFIKHIYPMPIQRSASITLSLDKPMDIDLKVYNQLGTAVTSIHQGLMQEGETTITWSTGDLPLGVYFLWLKARDQSDTKKIVVVN